MHILRCGTKLILSACGFLNGNTTVHLFGCHLYFSNLDPADHGYDMIMAGVNWNYSIQFNS